MKIWENLNKEALEGEIWKDIKGYEGHYMISNYGRVKSLERKKVSGIPLYEKLLQGSIGTGGYIIFHLYKHDKYVRVYGHRLAAEAFIDNPNHSPIVNHIDDDRTNNYIENLEWCNHSHNVKHAYRHDKPVKICGANHHNAKLTESDVRDIREWRKNIPIKEIARIKNVHEATIRGVLKGRTYSDVN